MSLQVIKLSKDNIEKVNSILKGETPFMLKITANWCSHCKTLEPEWESMKTQLNDSPGTIIDIVDESGEQKLDLLDKSLTKNVGFKGYPHIIAMKGGDMTEEFKEERNSENLKNFFTRNVIDMQKGGWRIKRTVSNRRRRRTPTRRRRRTLTRRRGRRSPVSRRRSPLSRKRKTFSRRRPRMRYRRGRGKLTKKNMRTRVRLGGDDFKRDYQLNKFRDLRRGTKLFPVI